MQRIAEGWGEWICGAADFVTTSLECSDMVVVRFVGYSAMGLVAALVIWAAAKLLDQESRRRK